MESININNIVMGDAPTYDGHDQVTLPQCHVYLKQRHHPIVSKTFEGIDPEGTHVFAVFVFKQNEQISCFWEQITHIERYPEHERLEVFRLVKGHWQHLQHPCLLQETDYHVRHRNHDAYQQVLFQAGKPLQSAELNDMQQQAIVQTRTLANTLYQNGFVPEGRERVISIHPDKNTFQLNIAACSVYVDGYFYHMAPTTLSLAASKDTTLGVYLSFQVIDATADPTLVDPATGRANAGQQGAKRLQAICVWGFDDALNANTKTPISGQFYAVQRIVNAEIVNSDVDVVEQWVHHQLIHHRRDLWGGHYILAGFEVSLVPKPLVEAAATPQQAVIASTFHIGKGKAHVQGFEVVVPEGKELTHQRLPWPVQHAHEAYSLKEKRFLPLAHQPVYDVTKVQVKQTKARHSVQFINVDTKVFISDVKEDVPEVLRVFAGETTFVLDTDYKVLNTYLEWLPSFNQLSNNSTFSIEYRYWETIDTTRYTLTEPNPATNARYVEITDSTLLQQENPTFRVDYAAYGLRHHQLALTPAGDFKFFDSQTDDPNTLAAVPADHLVLATFQSTNQVEALQNVALHSLSMQTVHTMLDRIEHLYQLVAEERLARQAQSDNASEHGIFIDSFYHDQQRDAHAETQKINGLRQAKDTSTVIGVASARDGVLSLPEGFQPQAFIDIELTPNAHGAYMLPLVRANDGYEVVYAQSQATSSMKINPYMAFQPMPAEVKLTPAIDHWRESRTQRLATRDVVNDTRRSWQRRSIRSVQTRDTHAQTTQVMQYMRPRTVAFTLKGFGAGEQVQVTMDGRHIKTIGGEKHAATE